MTWIDDLEERTHVRKELPVVTERIRTVFDQIKADVSTFSPETRERLSECLETLDAVSAMLDDFDVQQSEES